MQTKHQIYNWVKNLPTYWIPVLQSLLAVFSFHTAGFIFAFPRQVWSSLDWAMFGQTASQLGLHLILAAMFFAIAGVLVSSIFAFYDFVQAKYFIRARISIHDPRKGRWMRWREIRRERKLAKFGFLPALMFGMTSFFLFYLGGSLAGVAMGMLLLLLAVLPSMRGGQFPEAFLTVEFWLNNRRGSAFFVAIIATLSFLVGFNRHIELIKSPSVAIYFGDEKVLGSLITISSVGPIFFLKNSRSYFVLGDGFQLEHNYSSAPKQLE